MKKGKKHKSLKSKSTGKGRGLRSWRELKFFGRVWRVLWVTILAVWLLTVLQVLLGWFINPPLTPLMVQRWWQQVTQKDRPVHFERDYVTIDDISPNLVTAVVYSEDGLYMYHNGFDVKLYLAAISTAVPMTVVYAASNVIFLFFLADPIGRKLDRIKTVYGI